MRKIIALITFYSFAIQAATITDDKVLIGKKSSASAKELVFDTNDGTANKKLSVDKITKKLSITSDEAIVGDGTASDKALTFNRGGSNAQVKWNEVTDKLQFSNDGTTFKDLGTGGGGGGSTGVNVLTNDSFEDAVSGVLTDWSNTGGTLTQQTYTNSVEGDAKYFQFVATASGQYFEMSKIVPTSFSGGCQVDFKKLNIATADLFKVEALDGSNNVLASGNVNVSSWQKFPTLSFVCPAAGSTFKIRVTSLAAGTLQGDKAYLGSNQNVASGNTIVKQDDLYATGFTNFSGGGMKLTTIVRNSGYALSLDNSGVFTKVVALKNTKGVVVTFNVTRSFVPNGINIITRYNSANVSQESFLNQQSITGSSVGQGALTITLNMNAGDYLQFTDSNNTGVTNASISVTAQTIITSEETISPEQSSWFIDANIGGANPSLGTANVSSYTEITNPSLDLVNNIQKGSAPVEIACASGFSSTGLTCASGSESIGIAFVPPSTGLFEVCFAFTHVYGSSNFIQSSFQLAETLNNSSAIIQEGGTRTSSGNSVPSTQGSIVPQLNCASFLFLNTSKKTIRLFFEQIAGSATGSSVIAERDAAIGQRDIHVTVRPMLSAFNRPILTGDQVTAPGLLKPVDYVADISVTGAVTEFGADWISGNCNNNTSSNFQCTINPGITSVPMKCFYQPTGISNTAFVSENDDGLTTSSLITYKTWNPSATATQRAVRVHCFGTKP